MRDPFEVPVSGYVFRKKRRSGDRWMGKWRDADRQHQRVLGRVWGRGGRADPGYLTKRDAQAELDEILAKSRRGLAPAQVRSAARFSSATPRTTGSTSSS